MDNVHPESWAGQRVDPLVATEKDSTLVFDNVKLDDDPTIVVSDAMFCEGWHGCWVDVYVESTGTPTNLRLVAEFAGEPGDPGDWHQFLEGFWSTVFWEDQDTADGIRESLNLPFGGRRAIRLRLVATGTDADNYFEVTIRAKPYRPAVPMAHA